MRTLSTSFQSAANSQETGEAFLILLDLYIYENNGTTTLKHYVNNKVDVVSNGVTYEKSSFKPILGGDFKDKTPSVSIQFDVGDRELVSKLREVNKRPDLEINVVLASNPDVVEIGPITYELEDYQMSGQGVSANLIVEPVLNEPIPASKYSPRLTAGLWGTISVSDIPENSDTPPVVDPSDPSDTPDASEPNSSLHTMVGVIDPTYTVIKTSVTLTETWLYSNNGYATLGYPNLSGTSVDNPNFKSRRIVGVKQSVDDNGNDYFEIALDGVVARDYFSSILGENNNRVYSSSATYAHNGYFTYWRWTGAYVLKDYLIEDTQKIRIFE